MRPSRRSFDIFGLSFLDIMSCGFGAIVLLVLISKFDKAPLSAAENEARLRQVLSAETAVENLAQQLSLAEREKASQEAVMAELRAQHAEAQAALKAQQNTLQKLRADADGLASVDTTQKRTSLSVSSTDRRDQEVGGIPVDSDYVVFIVDTSGSMKEIWSRVVREIENVLRIHPQITGFQILNDNGAHLMSAYQGAWIPDTPARRKGAIGLLRSWNSTSNSSPVEGLEIALKRYAKPNMRVSIYIFGDEYTGSSYDPVINALTDLNTDRSTGERRAKIHAVGFLTTNSQARFATLMREVTRQSGGTFIALPR